ncbi:sensor histidine kinase [Streptacidiphilus fuscans]|uniref:histidine kinase n=1 Tax=Streptacidiphilus fuscans TaxID=2789292 RepID=A0A931FFN7_9ACTN|nr:ATP-binding protein [Streptacidiphilus fuscans]MBF9068584.1 PAS domain-containing protein [Streptacidiphilus fuscans]
MGSPIPGQRGVRVPTARTAPGVDAAVVVPAVDAPCESTLDPEDLPDGLLVADEHGVVVVFNRAAARITGLPRDAVLGRPLAEALPLEDLEGRRWWQVTDPYGGLAIRTRQPERNLLLPGPGGREILVSARYLRADGRTGPVRRVVVALRGTEARRRTERSHAELIATVAHELRSPLTSVKGFTATLLQKWERFTEPQKKLMLETVDADANRVTRLIAELLDISRIDSGRLEVRRQPVRLDVAVRRHVDGLVAAGVPEERFAVRFAEPLPQLWADSDKLDQVLGNLLENAVRHGEGTVTIEVEPAKSEEASGRVREGTAVTVSDQGPGIPEESIPRVFTRFWRGSKRGGTGLGLYIVKGIVEAHGGTIRVDRGPEGGASFRFILPAGIPEVLA